MCHSLLKAETWFAFVAHLNAVVVALVQGEMIVLTERINSECRSLFNDLEYWLSNLNIYNQSLIAPCCKSNPYHLLAKKSRKPIASSSPLFCYRLALKAWFAFVAYSSLVEMLTESMSGPEYRSLCIDPVSSILLERSQTVVGRAALSKRRSMESEFSPRSLVQFSSAGVPRQQLFVKCEERSDLTSNRPRLPKPVLIASTKVASCDSRLA
ncbi:hypothetical protein EV361DRAFT_181939 [Lentinula raphanica]|nr:hypothetical protein EV361DRAFT_181939 [Lentinula raphanica]